MASIPPIRSIIVLAGLGMLGCQNKPTLPNDPLFLTRKPLEVRVIPTEPIELAHTEPAPPPNPYFALGQPAVQGTLTSRPAGEP